MGTGLPVEGCCSPIQFSPNLLSFLSHMCYPTGVSESEGESVREKGVWKYKPALKAVEYVLHGIAIDCLYLH